jgi:hypothetical protein
VKASYPNHQTIWDNLRGKTVFNLPSEAFLQMAKSGSPGFPMPGYLGTPIWCRLCYRPTTNQVANMDKIIVGSMAKV